MLPLPATSVLVNGCLIDEFKLDIGFISIFFIAIEWLNSLILESIDAYIFCGYSIGDNFRVSHLQFTDDTLIVCDKSC